MISGTSNIRVKKQVYTVASAAGQSVFPLTQKLTVDSLVFVGQSLTDMTYTGEGTTTLTFTNGYKLEQGEVLTIK